MRAYVIVDLGFGDSGKGLLTDFLVRTQNAGVVVRYNGGAQAGHNVVDLNGRHHTFAQFGSGTFVPGVRTFLSRHVVVHPGALLVEGDILENLGVPDVFSRLKISEQALIITPFHQAANHIRELVRGDNRHGSCGVGVGEAYEDSINSPNDCVRAGDLSDLPGLKRKLESIRERKRSELPLSGCHNINEATLKREWEILENHGVIDRWIDSISRITRLDMVKPDGLLQNWLSRSETVVFEGAQGVLLDAVAGFHPHTTWSDCTGRNALDIIQTMAPDSTIVQLGVLRSHAVRHGNGPLPTETNDPTGIIREHNQLNEWQGPVRYGWFDAVMARYALRVAGQMDGLAVTHMDTLTRLNEWKYCDAYIGGPQMDTATGLIAPSEQKLKHFHSPENLSLVEREKHTQVLSNARPVLSTCVANENRVIDQIASLLGQPVNLVSRGQTASDVQILRPLA